MTEPRKKQKMPRPVKEFLAELQRKLAERDPKYANCDPAGDTYCGSPEDEMDDDEA